VNLSTFVGTAFGAALMLVSSATIAATTTPFEGSRAEVREACVGDGLVLVEGLSWSHCTSDHNEASVTCRDDGVCAGTGPLVASFDDLRRYGSDVVEASLSVPVGMPDSFPMYN
jgi:hypothetical protein